MSRRWSPSLAMLCLALLGSGGCTSSSDLERLQTSVDAMQLQILELRKDSPTREDLTAISSTLETVVSSLEENRAGTRADLRSVLDRVEELGGELEDSEFRLAQLTQQVAASQEELQAVRDLSTRARETAAQRPTTPRAAGADADNPQAVYDAAYSSYLGGNYDLAVVSFLSFLDRFASSPLADNASYWLGESYYRQSRFPEAIQQFDRVLSVYRGSDRAASSLLRKSYAYLELGQRSQGIVQLQKVVCEFGGTDEARLATRRLTELGLDADCAES